MGFGWWSYREYEEQRETEALSQIESGEADIVVGTHTLIQEPVTFHRLGLIITDEQHRFGVKQRAALREKGLHPDVLCMTATPIPRTLAITVFGEMDISTIDELPEGRQSVHTYWREKAFGQELSTIFEKNVKRVFKRM